MRALRRQVIHKICLLCCNPLLRYSLNLFNHHKTIELRVIKKNEIVTVPNCSCTRNHMTLNLSRTPFTPSTDTTKLICMCLHFTMHGTTNRQQIKEIPPNTPKNGKIFKTMQNNFIKSTFRNTQRRIKLD